MLEAVAADWSHLSDWEVHIAWDPRFGPWENQLVHCHPVETERRDLRQTWSTLAKQVDFVLVIAPEIGGALLDVLKELRRSVESLAPNDRPVFFNADETFIAAASDKWLTAQCFDEKGICHPPTKRLSQILDGDSLPSSSNTTWVIKPRDGAGCEGIRLVRSQVQLEQLLNGFRNDPNEADGFLIQPWIDGATGSIALLGGRDGYVLPAMTQRFDFEQCDESDAMIYQGGSGPWQPVPQPELESFARSVVSALPGNPAGWIGIDFVVSEQDGRKRLVAIEVNPRLTTSYLGLRRIVQPGPAELMCAAVNTTGIGPSIAENSIEFVPFGFSTNAKLQ